MNSFNYYRIPGSSVGKCKRALPASSSDLNPTGSRIFYYCKLFSLHKAFHYHSSDGNTAEKAVKKQVIIYLYSINDYCFAHQCRPICQFWLVHYKQSNFYQFRFSLLFRVIHLPQCPETGLTAESDQTVGTV